MKLTLPLPPSINHYWRSVVIGGRVRVLLSKAGRKYQVDCLAAVLANGVPKTLSARLQVTAQIFYPNRTSIDLDNRLKPMLDALTHCKIIADDSLIDDLRIMRGAVDKKAPRAEVTIESLT